MEKQKQMMKLVNVELKHNKNKDVLRCLLIIKSELEEINTIYKEKC